MKLDHFKVKNCKYYTNFLTKKIGSGIGSGTILTDPDPNGLRRYRFLFVQGDAAIIYSYEVVIPHVWLPDLLFF
jgi:hypothetical protein